MTDSNDIFMNVEKGLESFGNDFRELQRQFNNQESQFRSENESNNKIISQLEQIIQNNTGKITCLEIENKNLETELKCMQNKLNIWQNLNKNIMKKSENSNTKLERLEAENDKLVEENKQLKASEKILKMQIEEDRVRVVENIETIKEKLTTQNGDKIENIKAQLKK